MKVFFVFFGVMISQCHLYYVEIFGINWVIFAQLIVEVIEFFVMALIEMMMFSLIN